MKIQISLNAVSLDKRNILLDILNWIHTDPFGMDTGSQDIVWPDLPDVYKCKPGSTLYRCIGLTSKICKKFHADGDLALKSGSVGSWKGGTPVTSWTHDQKVTLAFADVAFDDPDVKTCIILKYVPKLSEVVIDFTAFSKDCAEAWADPALQKIIRQEWHAKLGHEDVAKESEVLLKVDRKPEIYKIVTSDAPTQMISVEDYLATVKKPGKKKSK